MDKTSHNQPVFIGIDIAKARLDICERPSGERLAVSRDQAGLDHLVERCQALAPTRIVMEATGGYDTVVLASLAAALPALCVDPRQVRDFAHACGRLAKTDRLDAEIIALFAERLGPRCGRCRMPLPRRSANSPSAGDRSPR